MLLSINMFSPDLVPHLQPLLFLKYFNSDFKSISLLLWYSFSSNFDLFSFNHKNGYNFLIFLICEFKRTMYTSHEEICTKQSKTILRLDMNTCQAFDLYGY